MDQQSPQDPSAEHENETRPADLVPDDLVQDDLVDEVSIDGMCGVY